MYLLITCTMHESNLQLLAIISHSTIFNTKIIIGVPECYIENGRVRDKNRERGTQIIGRRYKIINIQCHFMHMRRLA